MSFRFAVALSALVVATACADSAGGPANQLLGPAAVIGNPPPPAFSGSVVGDFQAADSDAKASRVMPGLSLELEGGSGGTGNPPKGIFRFRISGVEYNADSANTKFWMPFPFQPLPANLRGKIPPLKKGRIVVENGKSVGTGVIAAFDDANGGYWLIELSQFTQPYEVFVPGCRNQNWVNCITLDAPVVAVFYRILGVDRNGNLLFESYPSAPSFLTFASRF